nr:hypothetical protein [Prevotella sp.]
MIYKIVKGNSFKLHILVRKMDVSKEFQRLVDFDMSLATDIKVELSGFCCDVISVPVQVAGIQGNVLICDIPSSLDCGNYNVRVSWKYDGSEMVSIERNLLRIVEHNSMSNVPIGVTEGEHTGLFNLRYYIVTSNQSTCPVSFIVDNAKFNYTINDETQMVENQENFVINGTVKNGKKLEAEFLPIEGFSIGQVKIIMDGKDVTDEYYNSTTHKVFIPAVSGYVTITASGTVKASYYGASAAKNMGELNISDLTMYEGTLVGQTLTIATTEDKPYIWFASRQPLVFSQCGFEASLNTTKLGDLYYYWSDELVAGNDNEYQIKLKE